MHVAVIGSVESTRVCLHTLRAAPGVEVAAVVTLPPEFAQRHIDFVDVSPDAAECRAKLFLVSDSNAPDVVAELKGLDLEYLFVIGWSQLVKAPLMATAKCGVIGYHPTPLPRMRGRAAIPWTILLDEKITGSTLFWIDDGIDSGPILAQRFYHVAPNETAETLYARHMLALKDLMEEAIATLQTGAAPRRPQDERYTTWTAKRRPADGRIDWWKPMAEVWRLVRAVGRPYPGAFTEVKGEKLVLWRARPWLAGGARIAAMPGQIVAREGDCFAVRCGDELDLWVDESTWVDGASDRSPVLHTVLGR
jgi:methionyl-tRNA formyltransferase